MHINQLDSDCLLAIFEHFSLSQLLGPIGLVCSRWNQLQVGACARVHSLTLVCAERLKLGRMITEPANNPKKYRLLVDGLDGSSVHRILATFPRVVSFAFFQVRLCLDHLVALLTHWAASLRSLKVKRVRVANSGPESDQFDSVAEQWRKLVCFIEGHLTGLRHLTLSDYKGRKMNCHLPNMPQLKSLNFLFNISNGGEARQFTTNWKCLRKLCYSSSASFQPHVLVETETGQRYKKQPSNLPATSFRLAPPIAQQITHFGFFTFFEWSEFARAGHFLHHYLPNLTNLGLITIAPLELILTRYQLHKLAHLKHLTINNFRNFEIQCGRTHLPLSNVPPEPQVVPQYSALRALSLSPLPHEPFDWAFPLMPAVIIFVSGKSPIEARFKHACDKCIHTGAYATCQQLFIDSLKRWPSLRHTFVSQ